MDSLVSSLAAAQESRARPNLGWLRTGNGVPEPEDPALTRKQHICRVIHPALSGGCWDSSLSWNTFFCRVLILYNGQEEIWQTGQNKAAMSLV